jgi:glycosyltransferase involved in cell wall biosynthesis
MKRSVVIIAHNEELYIEKCILSVLQQTYLPDEIILVAHHCTDATLSQARQFPQVTIKELYGPSGIIYARKEGIASASGDHIFCIDGDAWAQKNWIESLDQLLLQNKKALVGSCVVYQGNLFWTFANWLNRILMRVMKNKESWIWGPSFAFSREQRPYVLERLKEFPNLHTQLALKTYPDDFWLALNFAYDYAVLFTMKTCVSARTKEKNAWQSFVRSMKDNSNVPKLIAYKKLLQGK